MESKSSTNEIIMSKNVYLDGLNNMNVLVEHVKTFCTDGIKDDKTIREFCKQLVRPDQEVTNMMLLDEIRKLHERIDALVKPGQPKSKKLPKVDLGLFASKKAKEFAEQHSINPEDIQVGANGKIGIGQVRKYIKNNNLQLESADPAVYMTPASEKQKCCGTTNAGARCTRLGKYTFEGKNWCLRHKKVAEEESKRAERRKSLEVLRDMNNLDYDDHTSNSEHDDLSDVESLEDQSPKSVDSIFEKIKEEPISPKQRSPPKPKKPTRKLLKKPRRKRRVSEPPALPTLYEQEDHEPEELPDFDQDEFSRIMNEYDFNESDLPDGY